ncbi:Hypothetical predicted protein, partial [Drosophila guanche]
MLSFSKKRVDVLGPANSDVSRVGCMGKWEKCTVDELMPQSFGVVWENEKSQTVLFIGTRHHRDTLCRLQKLTRIRVSLRFVIGKKKASVPMQCFSQSGKEHFLATSTHFICDKPLQKLQSAFLQCSNGSN